MPGPLLNPEVIQLSITSVPVILVGLAVAVFGFVVLIGERGSSIGFRYFFFAGSVGLYLFGAGVSYAVIPRELALIWERIAHVGVVFIPTTLIFASVALLGQTKRYRIAISLIAFSSVASTVFVIFTNLHIAGTRRVFWGWYPVYGPVGYLFVGVFSLVTVWALIIHLRAFAAQTNPTHRRRVGWSAVAIGIGLFGGADFLAAVGMPVYAFGFIPVFFFVSIMGAVIIRYRLADITPELAATPILNTMQGAVVVTDRAGVVRVANRVAGQWLSTGQRALADRPLSHVLNGISVKVHSEAAKATGRI